MVRAGALFRESEVMGWKCAEDRRAYFRAYYAIPENKAKKAAYSATPKGREKAARRQERVKAEYRNNPAFREKMRLRAIDKHTRTKYGITLAQRGEILAAQGGRCKICEREVQFGRSSANAGAHVDHCHETGRTRGILCGSCNTALGRLGDTEAALSRVVLYLQGAL